MTAASIGPAVPAGSGGWWPRYAGPADLEAIEAVPLSARRLPRSTYDALRASARDVPSRTALIVLPDGEHWDSPVEVTFRELLSDVHRIANSLTLLGVRRTDAVGLLSPNVAGLVPAMLAAQAAAIAAPVNPALGPAQVSELLRAAGARVLIAAGPEISPAGWDMACSVAESLHLDALLALRPTRPEQRAAVPLRPVAGVRVEYLHDFVAAADEKTLHEEPPGPHDLAAFFHTGGTTGAPKLAAHTHGMEVVDAWSVAAAAPLNRSSTFFAALPLFHVNALIVTTLAPILRGARTVWAGPLGYRDPALMTSFWRIVERYRVSTLSAVPSVYATLSGIPVDADISSLRLPLVGAAPLPGSVRDAWFAHTGIALCEGYGLTEATCVSARSFPDHVRTESVGQRLPYQRVAAVRVDEMTGTWTFLPAETSGTLAIAGPTVFPGYVTGRTADGPVLDDAGKVRAGWLDTGDLGAVSADGFVTVTRRAKDIIIRGGHNIDPSAVEAVLLAHPAVVDAAVVGRPDQYAGEVPVAFVVVRDPSVGADEIRRWAEKRVPACASIPKDVTIVDALPHTAVGKQYKLGLRIAATRQELAEKLGQIGYQAPSGDDWCALKNGRITVTLPTPTSAAQRAAVASLLDRYALAWELS